MPYSATSSPLFKRLCALIPLLLGGAAPLLAQNTIGNFPFSSQGAGFPFRRETVRQAAFSGAGVGLAGNYNVRNWSLPQYHQTLNNPALVYFHRVTNFELSAYSTQRNLDYGSTPEQKQDLTGGGLRGVNFAFPIGDNFSVGAGLNPYTLVDYSIFREESLPGDTTVSYRHSGTGGISRAHLSFGYKLTDNLVAGAEGSFLFGNIERQVTSWMTPPGSVTITEMQETQRFQGFGGSVGLYYDRKLTSKKDSLKKWVVSAGLAADLESTLPFETNAQLSRASGSRLSNQLVPRVGTPEDGDSEQPLAIRTGLGLKPFGRHSLLWSLALDGGWQNWAGYDQTGPDPNFQDSWYVATGGEVMPANLNIGYFSHVFFRGGARYEAMPYQVNNNGMNSLSASLGLGLPMLFDKRRRDRYDRSLPYINLSATYGTRSIGAENISEQFLRLEIGLTYNQDRWFFQRKIQ